MNPSSSRTDSRGRYASRKHTCGLCHGACALAGMAVLKLLHHYHHHHGHQEGAWSVEERGRACGSGCSVCSRVGVRQRGCEDSERKIRCRKGGHQQLS
ncbi:hypothetical protein PUN28_013618 [Cardiocondyla obscurior]|uniref:Uncharacterized protein n=1 Tax=Cardiocondyla obscurior TaxID=286306 RepID=A0AAW2F2B3_9HYME